MSNDVRYKKRTVAGNITALLYLAVVVTVAVASLYQGLSQYYTDVANASKSELIASKAVEYDSDNPNAYKIRGELSLSKNDYEAGLSDFESAVNLRPTDYILWLRVGDAHYNQRNFAEAEKAYQKAINLAPNYAQPRWLMGWLYLKQDNLERAFEYFNQATDIDFEYLLELLPLARATFKDDAAFDKVIKPKSLKAKKSTAFYFIGNNIASERNRAFLTSEELSDADKNVFVSRLIDGKDFPMAFAVWISKSENKNIALSETNRILNGDFETDIGSWGEGFGWQINREIENVDFAIDEQGAFSGSRTMEIEFEGNSNAEELILSQLALVEPNQRYRLTFAAATSEFTSGGLPIITLADANLGKIIGQSAVIASINGKWQKFTIDFRTGDSTKAIQVGVRRNRCDSNLCPAFGFLRLDGFDLRKLN